MTYEDILTIVNDHTRTPYQKAADLHALLASNGAKFDRTAAKTKKTTTGAGRPRKSASEVVVGSNSLLEIQYAPNGADHAG